MIYNIYIYVYIYIYIWTNVALKRSRVHSISQRARVQDDRLLQHERLHNHIIYKVICLLKAPLDRSSGWCCAPLALQRRSEVTLHIFGIPMVRQWCDSLLLNQAKQIWFSSTHIHDIIWARPRLPKTPKVHHRCSRQIQLVSGRALIGSRRSF